MKIFRVRVTRELRYELEVQAETAYQARDVATRAAIPGEVNARLEDLPVMDSHPLYQVGEPWVYGWSGFDPENSYYRRPDGHLDQANFLLIFKAPHGRAFTKSDVELLLGRIETLVGPVQKHWNGAGHDGLSVQMKVPYANLTEVQVAGLMAERGVTP